MNDEEWQFPAPMMEDPEVRGFKPPEAGESGARMVPDRNIVEGDIEEDGRKGPSGCPFSSP